MIDTRYKWVAPLIIIVSIGVVLYLAISTLLQQGKQKVVFDVLPTHADVSADDKKIGNGTQYLKPGTYTLTVSADGFKTETQKITVEQGKEQTVMLSLPPADQTGEKWMSDHETLYQKFEDRGGLNAQKEGQAQRKKFPIINFLPYSEGREENEESQDLNLTGFTIGYKAPKGDTLTVTIHADSSLGRRLALSKIKSWGYNPAIYNIEFVNYTYPLTAVVSQEQ